jgi:hypothetical protein
LPLKLFRTPVYLDFWLKKAIEVLIVDTTFMLKAVKNYHYNTEKKNPATSG